MVMTLASLKDLLKESLPPDTPELEIKELCCHIAGISRSQYLSRMRDSFDIAEGLVAQTVARRLAQEPLAYILGEWDFLDYTFKTDRRALIPRDDSAAVIYAALGSAKIADRSKTAFLLDLCCGGGALGISLAMKMKSAGFSCSVTLADISDDALELAADNAAKYGVNARVLKFDVLTNEPELPLFDIIICNPPYIRRGDIPSLDRSVRDYEPMLALDGGPDGLIFYRSIAENYLRFVKQNGLMVFEVGYDQSADVAEIMTAAGYSDVLTRRDMSGVERVVCGRHKA